MLDFWHSCLSYIRGFAPKGVTVSLSCIMLMLSSRSTHCDYKFVMFMWLSCSTHCNYKFVLYDVDVIVTQHTFWLKVRFVRCWCFCHAAHIVTVSLSSCTKFQSMMCESFSLKFIWVPHAWKTVLWPPQLCPSLKCVGASNQSRKHVKIVSTRTCLRGPST